jgi:hypothetical protein
MFSIAVNRHTIRILSFATAVAAIAACAKPKAVQLGDDRGLAPILTVVDSEKPPRTYTVTLAEPGHVAVIAVFPGRGASLVHPRDTTTTSAVLPAGTHQLRADTVRAPAHADSAIIRPFDRRMLDSARRADSSRYDRGRQREMGPPRVMLGPERAHLMLFVSRDPIDYASLWRRMQGVTIPIGPTEALSTVAKMARAATTTNRWAATALEVELRR